MLPVVAGFDKKDKLNGLPYHAKGEESEEIFNVLTRLSAPYGTNLVMEKDVIRLAL